MSELQDLLHLPNVVGYGKGTKHVKGVDTGAPAIVVFVRRKLPESQLKPEAMVPRSLSVTPGVSLPTDVVEVGVVKALGLPQVDIPPSPMALAEDPKAKYRPVIGGISCARERFSLSGTIGLPLLYKGGIPVLLSNNHVIALSYLNVKPVGGEPTRQPSVGDAVPEPTISNGVIDGTVIPVAATNQIAPGRVRILVNVPGTPGVTGSGYLCRVRFHAIGAGGTSSNIDLENGSLSNKKADAILATWPGDTVQVVAAAQAKAGPSTATASALATVSVDAPTTVAPGDHFNVDINISPVTDFDAALFDVVFNPAVLAIDDIEDYVAKLLEWEEILPDRNNTLDAAIAQLTVAAKAELLGLGEYKSTAEPEVGMETAKSGRSSGVTYGKVRYLDATIMVDYGLDTPMTFEGQVALEPMLIPGDSGSAIVRKSDNAVVALGFAGSDQISFATPIGKILNRFGLQLTPPGVPVEQALESIAGKYSVVWGFDASTQTWTLYGPAAPAFVSDLKALRKSQGYWIKMTEKAALTYKGFTWELTEGWNLIGWLED